MPRRNVRRKSNRGQQTRKKVDTRNYDGRSVANSFQSFDFFDSPSLDSLQEVALPSIRLQQFHVDDRFRGHLHSSVFPSHANDLLLVKVETNENADQCCNHEYWQTWQKRISELLEAQGESQAKDERYLGNVCQLVANPEQPDGINLHKIDNLARVEVFVGGWRQTVVFLENERNYRIWRSTARFNLKVRHLIENEVCYELADDECCRKIDSLFYFIPLKRVWICAWQRCTLNKFDQF